MSTTYDSSAIEPLATLGHIRRHPTRYLADTGSMGVTHLALELIGNAIDEAVAGHVTAIEVALNADGSIAVSDDGRGIPVDAMPGSETPAAEIVVTVPRTTAKASGGHYLLPGGANGLGLPVVAALSQRLELAIDRGGQRYEATFASSDDRPAHVTSGTRSVGRSRDRRTGTTVTMWPDPAIFGQATVDPAALVERMRTSAALHPALGLTLRDQRSPITTETVFSCPDGLAALVPEPDRDGTMLGASDGPEGRCQVAVAPAHGTPLLRSFVHDVETHGGGDHLDGVLTMLPSAGWHAIVSVRVASPAYERSASGHRLRSDRARALAVEATALALQSLT